MSITIGFIVLFISVIIPGKIFRRFYYFGEFSKQFNTKDPVLHSIYFSIIPGIIIQIVGLTVYEFLFKINTSNKDILEIFNDISFNKNNFEHQTIDFINNNLSDFFCYIFGIFLFSAFLGFILSRLIRKFNFDKKYKLFRYKNQWFYIFSGEILNTKKFKEGKKVTFKNNEDFDKEISVTYADILEENNNGKKILYSGYVVDYDLNYEDTSKLDRIYLLDTYINKKKKKKTIPGDVFILKSDKIKNINLTYIPSIHKKNKKEEKKNKKVKTKKLTVFIVIVIILFAIIFYRRLIPHNIEIYSKLENIGFWGKTFLFLFILQILSFFIPNNYEETGSNEDKYSKIGGIILLIIFGILTYVFVVRKII